MKKLSETYKELGIAFKFPIEIRDADGNETYREDSDGYCHKYEWDAKGNATYYENSNDWCRKWERDAKGNETYYDDSDGFWYKKEYDSNGNETYYENSHGTKTGTPKSFKTCNGKVIEVDGHKYKLIAL